jgi:hypothetical protein
MPAETTVPVEKQLDETMDQIVDGARPWRYAPADLQELRDWYRPGFEKNKQYWPKIRDKILRISKYEGAVAGLLSETLYQKNAPPDRPISRGCMWAAAYIVQIACPPQFHTAGQRVLGPSCPPGSLESIGVEAQGVLATAAGLLMKISSREKLARVVFGAERFL